jgi:hypothetical protein
MITKEEKLVMKVLDTSQKITNQAACLRRSGYECVMRYYTRSLSNPKLLKSEEARAIAGAGLSLAVVYQDFNNSRERFDYSKGYSAGQFAYNYAQDEIGQPENSAIYFAVDYDASQADVEQVIRPYFQGVADAFREEADGSPGYTIGIYGSGLVCRLLLDSDNASYAWLAGARGWRETREFDDSKRWHLKQKLPTRTICGVAIDDDLVNPERPDFGAFSLAGGQTRQYEVIARSGLRLRSGPGLGFDTINVMPFRSRVFLGRRQDDWVEIDLQGDGFVDGWAYASYLRPI